MQGGTNQRERQKTVRKILMGFIRTSREFHFTFHERMPFVCTETDASFAVLSRGDCSWGKQIVAGSDKKPAIVATYDDKGGRVYLQSQIRKDRNFPVGGIRLVEIHDAWVVIFLFSERAADISVLTWIQRLQISGAYDIVMGLLLGKKLTDQMLGEAPLNVAKRWAVSYGRPESFLNLERHNACRGQDQGLER